MCYAVWVVYALPSYLPEMKKHTVDLNGGENSLSWDRKK